MTSMADWSAANPPIISGNAASSANNPPSIVDASNIRTFLFPFQLGQSGFPAMSPPERAIFQSIQSLLMTGQNERLMHPEMGVNIHRLVFSTMTPILQARIAMEVRRAIEDFEPRAQVIGVESRMGTRADGVETAVFVDVLYRVAGQVQSQQVEIPMNGSGQNG